MSEISLTVGIKSLNEEKKIGECLTASVEAIRLAGGEVVLADSGSTDRTIEIARGFPVRIVQFADLSERGCGAGAQLAFQHAQGRYFYMLDGDMIPHPEFVTRAIAYLEAHPKVAGVGGQMRERNVENIEFAKRAEFHSRDPDWVPGPVRKLDGGGIYRTEAVREAGFFADRNLHAFEEYDLAARLRARGWELHRIADLAMDHFGHSMAGWPLLWRRFRGGYMGGAGEVLRAALGRPQLPIILRLGHVRTMMVVWGWWAACVATPLLGLPWWLLVALLLAPLLLLRVRQGSWDRAVYTFAMWNAVGAGALGGLFRRRVDPATAIRSVDLSAPDAVGARPSPQAVG